MSMELAGIGVDVPDGTETLTILDDATLQVAAGDVVVLTGPSGSGKSTLLAVAGLLRRPDRGRVRIGGVDATDLSGAARAQLRGRSVGLVFQTSNLFPSLTAVEQLELVAHASGRLDRAAKDRARELLDRVGLAEKMDRRPNQLSGGERQRVGVARALMNQPEILLADEPTASLDAARAREVMGVLVEQATEAGVATLIVTHSPDQVNGATRAVHIDAGRIVTDRVTA